MPITPAYQKRGLPPGTPAYTGSIQTRTVICATRFDEQQGELIQGLTPSTARQLMQPDKTVWVEMVGMSDEAVVVDMCRAFGAHKLAIEDILEVGTRAKIQVFDDRVLVVLKVLHLQSKDTRVHVQTEHVCVLLGPNFVLTFQERDEDPFGSIRHRLQTGQRHASPARLLHAIIDAIVDDYFEAVEDLGNAVESLEEQLMDGSNEDALLQIQEQRRATLLVRRAVRPVREVIYALRRLEGPASPQDINKYYTDVSDHIDQILESLELYRDMVMGMVDLHHTTISDRLNDTMKVLTVVSTIFVPLTFLSGLYGMNFAYMPETQIWYAYYVLLGIMAFIALALAVWFKAKRWF